MDSDSGVAGVPGVSARTGRRGEDTETVGAAQACSQEGFECRGCGQRLHQVHRCAGAGDPGSALECLSRDGDCGECIACDARECGVLVEKIDQLPSKAPFSKRFEEIVGEACESAAVSQVARRSPLWPETTVRAIDLRYLGNRCGDQRRRKPAL